MNAIRSDQMLKEHDFLECLTTKVSKQISSADCPETMVIDILFLHMLHTPCNCNVENVCLN